MFPGRLIKFHGPKKVPMVCDGYGRHMALGRKVHEPVDPAGAVEQTVIRMQMQMDKVFGSHSQPFYQKSRLAGSGHQSLA
jgi:hypothetical protein